MAHVHAELIKAWAEGAKIQVLGGYGKWVSVPNPRWREDSQYRVEVTLPVFRIAKFRLNKGVDHYMMVDTVKFKPEENANFVKFVSDPIKIYE